MLKNTFFTGVGMVLGATIQAVHLGYYETKQCKLNRQFIECSQKGNLEFIRKNFSDPQLNKETKHQALKKSIEKDQLSVFEYLLNELNTDQKFLNRYKSDIWNISRNRRSSDIMNYMEEKGIKYEYKVNHEKLVKDQN